MLDYYLEHFDTVELNNSFYRLPTPEAFDSWREATPPNFVYAVKASRFLTHNKKLKDPDDALQKLLPRATRLEHKLGPILFQLPPRWRVNVGRLENLLAILPSDIRYAFECRDLSWMTSEVTELLCRFHAGLCIYELGGYRSPLTVTADFAYVRLHGPEAGKYQGSYTHGALGVWARQIEEWSKDLSAIYIYFDNDQEGHAPRNALTLKRLLSNAGA